MTRIYQLLAVAILLCGMQPLRADTTVGTPISSTPFFITKPGKYRLTKQLIHQTGGPAITISARDVVLDLNGFTILGPTDGEEGTVGVAINGVSAVIRNGTIRRFGTAIADFNASAQGTLVEDVLCMNQGVSGIELASEDCILRRVVVRNTGSLDTTPPNIAGIRMTGSSILENCTVQNIPARQNVSPIYGIRIAGGSHVVKECDVHGVAGAGLSAQVDISTIIERTRIRECNVGLAVAGATTPLLREGSIRDCGVTVTGTFADGGRNQIE